MADLAGKFKSLGVSDVMVLAVVHHAERQAYLTAGFLRAAGFSREQATRLPVAFLLELAAVLELGRWELLGIRQHLVSDLPSYDEAFQQLAVRCRKGAADFREPNATLLAAQVFREWIEKVAWDGPVLLGGEFAIQVDDGDAFVDLLAQFIWSHRHRLQQIIQCERDSENGS